MTVDIVRVVGERLVLTKLGDGHYRASCPFHKDRAKSLHVDVRRGSFQCYGCSASGDAARFVELLDGVSYTQATQQLADRFGATA
jgi:DNA primase